MARWKLIVQGAGVKKASVEKLAKAMRDQFGKETSVSVTDDSPPESRADRFQTAIDDVSGARAEVEELRDELQNWYDNLPDNFREGDKGEQIQSAIDELETVASSMEEVENASVEFPGMY